jgi:excisionase family DNA binding protein
MEIPTLYTPSEVANYLHVSRATVYNLLKSNQIESIIVGRNRRFTAQQVKDYINRRGSEVMY